VLFIDARKLGHMVDRTHRELTEDDITRITGTYHAWRGEREAGEYTDVPGFCSAVALEEIAKHSYVPTPGRYVGAEETETDDEAYGEKMQRLVTQLREQTEQARRLEEAIGRNLGELGYGK
jgi:type I restriction enzyme M protein